MYEHIYLRMTIFPYIPQASLAASVCLYELHPIHKLSIHIWYESQLAPPIVEKLNHIHDPLYAPKRLRHAIRHANRHVNIEISHMPSYLMHHPSHSPQPPHSSHNSPSGNALSRAGRSSNPRPAPPPVVVHSRHTPSHHTSVSDHQTGRQHHRSRPLPTLLGSRTRARARLNGRARTHRREERWRRLLCRGRCGLRQTECGMRRGGRRCDGSR